MHRLSPLKALILLPSDRLRLFLDISSLSASTVASRVLLLIRDLVLARFFSPALYGVWTQMLIIFNYSLQLPLGFQHAMSREVPYYRGQKVYSRVKVIQDIVFVIMLSTAALACAGILLAYRLFDYRLLGLSPSALLIVGGVVVAQQIYAFYSILLRAYQKFNIFSIGFVSIALLSMGFAIVAAPRWGANGAALSLGVAYIFVTLVWLFQAEFRLLSIAFPFDEFRKLARLALPLFFVGLGGLLIVSMDRLAVAFFYSKEQIGFYGLAFLVTQSISLITTPVVQAISPRLMEAYGRHRDARRVRHYLVVLTVVMGGGVALLIGGIYLVIGDLFPLLLPRFVSSVEPARILLIGGSFSILANGANQFLVAMDKQSQVLRIQAGVVVLQALSIATVVYIGGSIKLIAWVMVVSYILYATICLLCAGRSVENSVRQGVDLWFRSCLPVFYVLLSTVLISRWYFQTLDNSYMVIAFHFVIWSLAVIPMCFYLKRQLFSAMGAALQGST